MTQILVIDDEISIVEMLSAFLEEEGWQVTTASNGQEGLERLASVRPAVVVSDVMMPVLDGWELCRWMQADPRYQSIPLVLMSAVRTTPGLTGCNYAALLRKPFELEEMLQTITRLLKPNASS
jgi:two-component system, OmpR family, alkaline phosphatase synthesis response regulator PhoP